MMATSKTPACLLHASRFLALSLLLLGACSKQNQWAYDHIDSVHKEHSSSKLSYIPSDHYNGIDVDWVQTTDLLKVYLNVHSTPIPPYQGESKSAKVLFNIGDSTHAFVGYRFEGGQKILLDETATHLLNEALEKRLPVTIALVGYKTTIDGSQFPEQIKKLDTVSKWNIDLPF